MWELLQKLENLGWKPYGKSIAELSETEKNVRLLTSLSSGLWQFVCENALYSYTNCVWKGCEGPVVADYIEPQSYKYRLIESALCDEDKLEEFLLKNIKVE